ncbi:hypothetical protein KRMM14A1259_32160 [Krasilnikovia sp. MM14-A1259]
MNLLYLVNILAGHLPMLAVVVGGFVLLGVRRARLGKRVTSLAQAGLAALALAIALQSAWSAALPFLIQRGVLDVRGSGPVLFIVGMATSVLVAGGVGLLLGAVLARAGRQEPVAPQQDPYAPVG